MNRLHLTALAALASTLLACAGDSNDPNGSPTSGLPEETPASLDAVTPPPTADCPLSLAQAALYQAVKVPLGGSGAGGSHVDVIRRKPALVRAFVQVAAPVDARVRLTVATGGATRTFEDSKRLEADSGDADLASTFNFDLPPEAMDGDLSWSIEILSPAACGRARGGRLPTGGAATLRTRTTGVLKVRLVPVRYQGDRSGRMPDTSPAQVARFRDLLRAVYPVEEVEVSVRDAVETNASLADKGGWNELLESMRALRAQDRPADDVYYYGVVAPAVTFSTYCGRSCVAGLAYQVVSGRSALRAGVGLGFTGAQAADTLAHELGHEHGRAHAPCNTTAGIDAAFPHQGGGVGVWGWDARTRTLQPPSRMDLMGYCSPRWISDYTWQALAARGSDVNSVSQALRSDGVVAGFRSLLVSGEGEVRWGVTVEERAPVGTPEAAAVFDAAGVKVADTTVYRVPIADGEGSTVLVPTSRPGWHAIAVAGSPPIGFSAAALRGVR